MLVWLPASMIATLMALLVTLWATVRSRLDLHAEVLALRHQLGVLQRQAPHLPRLRPVDRLRRILHMNVTAHPTAAWTAQETREAFPWDSTPRFLLRDRDSIYGSAVRRTVQEIGLEEVLTAPRAPWQNPFAERMIGSLRRECLDHMIVWNERSLRRHLSRYLAYYHGFRTHLGLAKNAPISRPVQPLSAGAIVEVAHVGGLHHHYERRAA